MKEDLFKKIESLGFDKKDFIVLGSAVMQAKGIRVAGDLEFLVRQELFEKLKDEEKWEFKKDTFSGIEREFLEKDGMDIFKDFWVDKNDSEVRKDFDHFIKDGKTEIIDGINFISLKYILFVKSLWRREKDIQDVKLIEEYLKNTKD